MVASACICDEGMLTVEKGGYKRLEMFYIQYK